LFAFSHGGDYAEALCVYANVLSDLNRQPEALEKANHALAILRLPTEPARFTEPELATQICDTLIKIYEQLGQYDEVEKYKSLAKQLQEKAEDE